MKIGALAEATATPVETIRYYEREGLLPPPARADNNYRVYRPEHAERLRFIRQCRGLDMTLDEIRALIALRESPGPDCGEINGLLDAHIGHVTERITALLALRDELQALRDHCTAPGSIGGCGILQELDRPRAEPPAVPGVRGHVHGSH